MTSPEEKPHRREAIARLITAHERGQSTLAGRLERLDPEVFSEATTTLGSPEKAAAWLVKPSMLLGSGTRAVELLATPEGREEVLRMLGRLRNGSAV